ncbi:MAG: hypothetical protein RLW87_20675 [Alphaproteobacteria bacterium]
MNIPDSWRILRRFLRRLAFGCIPLAMGIAYLTGERQGDHPGATWIAVGVTCVGFCLTGFAIRQGIRQLRRHPLSSAQTTKG